MIRRPINARFREAVLSGKKTTTIRDQAWPVGVPIMLYSWSGVPYKSKQVDLAVVIVAEVLPIRITHHEDCGMRYYYEGAWPTGLLLHETEGLSTWAAMDDWFRPLVPPGKTVEKTLIKFRLYERHEN